MAAPRGPRQRYGRSFYEEIRERAGGRLANEGAGHTLSAPVLAHDNVTATA
jgi:hypothetical protein